MTRSRHLAPPRRIWEAHELAIMRRNYAHFPTAKIGALAGMVRKQLKGPKAE